MYCTFENHGVDAEVSSGYNKIRTHLVYAVKHNGRYKARMVAN